MTFIRYHHVGYAYPIASQVVTNSNVSKNTEQLFYHHIDKKEYYDSIAQNYKDKPLFFMLKKYVILLVIAINTKTIVLTMVVIAATAALAVAPVVVMHHADAAQPRICYHKGTGEVISCDDENGNNAVSTNRGGQQPRP
jgi:hypothetical protein